MYLHTCIYVLLLNDSAALDGDGPSRRAVAAQSPRIGYHYASLSVVFSQHVYLSLKCI